MSLSPKLLACFIFLVGFYANGSLTAADTPFWPRFHGPNGDNISTDTGLLKKWPDDGPKLVWTAQGFGKGFAGVTIADGLIYTAGNIDDDTVLTALDLTGAIQWQQKCGQAWTRSHPGTRGTPTIDGDRLYYETPLGDVVCLNAKTGKEIWGLNILKEFDGANIIWALAESLLVDGGNLICCPFGKKASIVALDKLTGRTVWTARSTGDKAGYATTSLVEYGGLRMILTMNQKGLVGANADNGDLLFRYEHVTRFDVNVLKPIFRDGKVFISSGYRAGSELLKLNVTGPKVTAERVWESKEMDNHHGGVVLLDGYLYGAASNANRGSWICLDWNSGEMKYAERGVGKGSVTSAEGMLYTMSEKAKVGLVKATPNGHEIISQFSLPPGGDGPTWAHPVVCDGRLYIRHGDRLFAYDVRAK